jgi:flagellar assembly factor FliW
MESKTESVKAELVTFPRFGDMLYREGDVVEFPWGMPGFRDHHRWLILAQDSYPGYVWLQSLDDLTVAMPATYPWAIFESYEPEVPAYAFAALGIQNADDFTYLCTVTVSPGAAEMTMNLASPIVINLRARKALQVSLRPGAFSTREPIPRTTQSAKAS